MVLRGGLPTVTTREDGPAEALLVPLVSGVIAGTRLLLKPPFLGWAGARLEQLSCLSCRLKSGHAVLGLWLWTYRSMCFLETFSNTNKIVICSFWKFLCPWNSSCALCEPFTVLSSLYIGVICELPLPKTGNPWGKSLHLIHRASPTALCWVPAQRRFWLNIRYVSRGVNFVVLTKLCEKMISCRTPFYSSRLLIFHGYLISEASHELCCFANMTVARGKWSFF